MPTPSAPGLSTQRVLSYLGRLPLFTRGAVAAIVLFEVAALACRSWWDVRAWGALVPDEIGFATLYRTNTYPFIHVNLFHLVVNLLSLTPMLERFESEHGTLTSVALFLGPLSTVPAFIYVGIEKLVLGWNTPVMGASIWFFLLVGIEAVRTYRVNPYFVIGGQSIPTWTAPIAMLLAMVVLVPGSSGLGHLSGLVFGYLCGLGVLKVLAPPEKVLRWIEGKLNLLGRLPHYVSVDQKTKGRFGVLPMSNLAPAPSVSPGLVGSTQRLGP